jgi:hypothetical protein
VTGIVESAVASSPEVRDGLDWQRFRAAYLPESRRHDLKAIAAYGAYSACEPSHPRPTTSKRRTAGRDRPRDKAGKTRAARYSGSVQHDRRACRASTLSSGPTPMAA